MKVKNKTTGNWDQITLGSVTIDNSLGSDSTTHGASVHAVNTGLAGKISGDGSVEKIVRSETAPTGTEATIWIEPSDFDSAETAILKDTLEDADLDKAPTVHAVKQAIDAFPNITYDAVPAQGVIEYTGSTAPTGYSLSTINYNLNNIGQRVDAIENILGLSLEEKIVGYWINGKPLYRRTLRYSVTTSGEITFTCNHTDYDLILFDKNFTFLVRSNGTIMTGPGANNDPYAFDARSTRAVTGELLFYVGSSIYSGATLYATIYYTKSTDKEITITEVLS
jgi:hypothetical protein